jgi:hypothetical protein
MTEKLPPLPEPDLGSIQVGREEVTLGHSTEALQAYALRAIRESEAVQFLRTIRDEGLRGDIEDRIDTYLASLDQK